jgi:hypothetical protein
MDDISEKPMLGATIPRLMKINAIDNMFEDFFVVGIFQKGLLVNLRSANVIMELQRFWCI